VLTCSSRPNPRGLRLPIDFFFRSLADDQQEQGIGVILSGMGSDGTLGLRAIKEKAGAVFVQDPASAKFDGMPRSAVDAGQADVVAPVERAAGPHPRLPQAPADAGPARTGEPRGHQPERAGEGAVVLLRARTGQDFSLYKKSTSTAASSAAWACTRSPRSATTSATCARTLRKLDLLFKELLIGVTRFFRDPEVWEQLRTEASPRCWPPTPRAGLRAWTAGCSTGEEAYSLAIVFRESCVELAPAARFNFGLQIFATDLDRDAIDKARTGPFPPTSPPTSARSA
jgi:two-component system CheB/CheR fusion protein